MSRPILLALLLTASVGLTVAMGAAKDKSARDKARADGLSPKLHEVIANVEAACAEGDIEKVWHLLAKPINGLNEDLAARFDEALAAKKLPPARELLVQARLKVLMENRAAALPSPKERLLILGALQDYVQKPLEQIAGQALLQEDLPAPKNMDEFDRRFHDIHEVQSKLWLAKTCAGYAGDLAAKLPATARKKLTEKELETVTQWEGDLLTKLQEKDREVRELELETRVLRLKYGVEVLQQKQLTKEKFIAAATTRQDARILKQELEPPAPVPAKGAKAKAATSKAPVSPPAPPVFHREALKSPDLAKEVATLARHVQEAAGALADKAERFYAGLEFWLRGRYGWGPDVGGLAKSGAALEKPELLHQVYMPENLLTLADVKGQPMQSIAGRRPETRSTRAEEKVRKIPTCPDRRHHYTWAWEDRRLLTSTMAQPTEQKSGQEFTHIIENPRYRYSSGRIGEVDLVSGWQGNSLRTQVTDKTVSVPPQDPRLIYRIVGLTEYSQAVQLLDQFVAEASIGEFEVAEEIIRSQDAFRIDTNLSRKIEGPSTLSEQSPNPRDDFSRHGLEWMLALARVELGAMLAGFTSHAEPFLSLAPTTYKQERVKTVPFGTAAYGELLMDGLRAHYWSIVREDLISNFYKTGVPENHLLTQSRRAIVGRQFVRAVLQFGGGGNEGENLPPVQRTELQTWDQTFEKLQRIMLYCLTFKVGREKRTNSEFSDLMFDSFTNKYISGRSIKGTTTERDQTPDAIRRLILLADPTLAGCGCQ